VRNKRTEAAAKPAGDKVVLYVHGQTYPSETTFDLALNGFSWMDYIAARGYDVYLMDVRGFGRSTRPRAMSEPPDRNEPIVRTADAVQDVATVVDFIRERRGVDRINLLGWSWGTRILGWYASSNNDKVNKLALYAPGWIRKSGTAPGDTGGKLGAYRTVTRDAARARWLAGVPEDRKAGLIPDGWFDAWADATFAADPEGGGTSIRAPNGMIQDSREYWNLGKALYDPGLIRVPTLLVHAEWDVDLPSSMLHEYFAKLTNAPYRRCVEIGEGTHSVIMEKNRMQLFEAVQQFLDEDFRPGR
jgi:pimeloyl-ACP methyl ester carboxylesterase